MRNSLTRWVPLLALLATPTVAQPMQGNWTELGVRRESRQLLATTAQSSLSDCRVSCALRPPGGAAPACMSYVLDPANTCSLFADRGRAVEAAGFVSGIRDADTKLTVLYFNAATSANVKGPGYDLDWRTRFQNLADQLARLGERPDVIMVTELHGESSGALFGPFPALAPYEMLEHLHGQLLTKLGIEYRIANQTGVTMDIGLERLGGTVFQAEALLYNPAKLVNLTPGDVQPLHFLVDGRGYRAPHDEYTTRFEERGVHLRASLPVCGAFERFARRYLDGPAYTSGWCTGPSGPAWNQQYHPSTGRWRRLGAVVRLAMVTDPAHPIEFFNMHTTQRERPHSGTYPLITEDSLDLVDQFVAHQKGAPLTPRHFAPLMANDLNVNFLDPFWFILMSELYGWDTMDWLPIDQLGFLHGVTVKTPGLPLYADQVVLHPTRLARTRWLPEGVQDPAVAPQGCDLTAYTGAHANRFSDHCGGIAELEAIEEVDVLPFPGPLAENAERLLDGKFMSQRYLPWCKDDAACKAWLCSVVGQQCQ